MSSLKITRKNKTQPSNPPKAANDFPPLAPSEPAPQKSAPKPQQKIQIQRKKTQGAQKEVPPKPQEKKKEEEFPSLSPSEPEPQPQQKQQQQQQAQSKNKRKKGKKAAAAAAAAESAEEPTIVPVKEIEVKKEVKKIVEEEEVEEEEEKVTTIITKGVASKGMVDDNDITDIAVPPVSKKASGSPVDLLSNYYFVVLSPGKVIYEYTPIFKTDFGLRRKKKILELHKELGVFATDGNHLYTPQLLSPDKLKWTFRAGKDDGSAEEHEVRLKKTKEIKGNDQDIWRVLNIIKGGLLQNAGLQRIGRNYFRMEDKDAVNIPGVPNITFFPGITASFTPIQRGAAFVADILYKAVRKDTVLDVINNARRNTRIPERESILKNVVGISIITLYSKRPYVIDDVDFTITPASTFDWKPSADKPAKKVSYEQYVTERYGRKAYTKVTDRRQYMLVVNRKSGEKIYLIPELCRLTGLPDEMRRDYRIMASVAEKTHPGPSVHAEEINKYARSLAKEPAPVRYMRPWGISLESSMLPLKGTILPPPTISVGRSRKIPGFSSFKGTSKPDFTFDLMKSAAKEPASLKKWVAVIPEDRDGAAESFVCDYLIDKLNKLGGHVGEPIWVVRSWGDLGRPGAIKDIINREVVPHNPEFALFVLTSDNAESYNTIKRIICADLKDKAFPTQVIKYKTLSNPKKVQGVSNKVAIQIVAKLGGVGYTVEVTDPVLRDGTMVVGIDVCHKGSAFKKGEKKSVVGLVASVDNTFVHCWAEPRIQAHRQEIVTDLIPFVERALAAYKAKNMGKLPKQVIVYRDGVGDGQLGIVLDEEVKQFDEAFRRVTPAGSARPRLVFIVVKKNTNTRLFENSKFLRNPQAGTVVSSEIVHKGWYEFFLVPHVANQGMVSPTNFVVLRDELKLDPVSLQTFTYHQCFIYQNWSGSIKVPAMCQNAHKMSFLVGENIAEDTSRKLSSLQFFL